MKKLTIMYLEGCPYCREAEKALNKLKAQDPALGAVDVEWIEENRSPQEAAKRDYYYVPSIFCGSEKLYECRPGESGDAILQQVEKALRSCL